MANVQIKKRPYNKYHQDAVHALALRYNLTDNFVRKALRSDRSSEMAERICKEYPALVRQFDENKENTYTKILQA